MKFSVLEFLLTSNKNVFRDVRKCVRVPVALASDTVPRIGKTSNEDGGSWRQPEICHAEDVRNDSQPEPRSGQVLVNASPE
jgi:hypothetical protein